MVGYAAPQEFAQPEMTEEERKKMELEQDEVFMKYYKAYKITKNLANIKLKMRQEGMYEPKLMDLFAEGMDVRATQGYNWLTISIINGKLLSSLIIKQVFHTFSLCLLAFNSSHSRLERLLVPLEVLLHYFAAPDSDVLQP